VSPARKTGAGPRVGGDSTGGVVKFEHQESAVDHVVGSRLQHGRSKVGQTTRVGCHVNGAVQNATSYFSTNPWLMDHAYPQTGSTTVATTTVMGGDVASAGVTSSSVCPDYLNCVASCSVSSTSVPNVSAPSAAIFVDPFHKSVGVNVVASFHTPGDASSVDQDVSTVRDPQSTGAAVPPPAGQETVLLFDILVEVQYLTGRLSKEVETQQVCNDWKFAAMVIDRMCLWLFSIFTVISTGAILFSAPHTIV